MRGSNMITVAPNGPARWQQYRGLTARLARHHVGVGDHQVRAHGKPAPLVDGVARLTLDLLRRRGDRRPVIAAPRGLTDGASPAGPPTLRPENTCGTSSLSVRRRPCSAGGGEGRSLATQRAIADPAVARAGHPGKEATEGSRQPQQCDDRDNPEPGAKDPIHLADRPERQRPLQSAAHHQAERLADHGPGDQEQHGHADLHVRR